MSDAVEIEIRGLEVLARIGVSDAELEVERPLVIDLTLTVPANRATETDRIEDTIDYAAAASLAANVATGAPHRTLERLAAEIADALAGRLGCERIEVRVAKPQPPMDAAVDHVAVTIRREEG